MNSTGIAAGPIQEFAGRIRGPVITPGNVGYDEARAVRNGMIDRRPALIVQCSGAADVIAAVDFARDNGLLLSVRGGGHNVAGNAVNDGGLVIDLSRMRGVHVDARARTARAQGGATWGDLDRETQVFGLATPGGVVSTTGVAGLTLHGGLGHLRRPHGLSLDNLLSVDIVTADGQLRTASADNNADLFWAVRGAGSNFGVITSFQFRLHPVGPTVMLGATMYRLEDAPAVLRQWRAFIHESPEAFTPIAIFWNVPEGFPPEAAGTPVIIIAGVYAGPVEEGEKIVQPMRSFAPPVLDLSAPMPFTAVQSAFDPFFPMGLLMYWKSTYVDELGDDLIDALCELATTRPSPRSAMVLWPLLGAPSRVAAADTAFGRRAPFLVTFESSWTDRNADDANIAWSRTAHAAVTSRFAGSGVYLNFPGFGEEKVEMARAAYGENFDRLVRLKTEYDPGNLFRMNINIPPAG